MGWLQGVFGFLGAPFTAWVEGNASRKYMKEEGRLEITKSKVQLEVAKQVSQAERLLKNDVVDAEYDMQAQKERRHTIADEILILCTIVLVGCHFFIPEEMASGWEAMGYTSTPWWLEFIIVGIFISVFGLMRLFRAWSPFNKVTQGSKV